MARIRTIKPEFWRDEDLSSISAEAALLAIGLLNFADDEGYFSANTKLIECDVFPLRELSITVPVLLRELSSIGYVRLFEAADKKQYGHISNFKKHQVISKPQPSKIKSLDVIVDDSGNGTGTLHDDSGNGTGTLQVGKERKGKEGNRNGEEGSADDVFKITIKWRPSSDAHELIKVAKNRLPSEEVLNGHISNFVGYWRTREDARRQDQWDHAFADWVVKHWQQDNPAANPDDIYINVLGQRIDTTDRAWIEVFKKDNDQHTPERFRIDREATRAARKQVAA